MVDVKVEVLPHAPADLTFEPANPGDAGIDLYSADGVDVGPMETKLVKTGIKVSFPPGFMMQIVPRSGLALKWGITVLNAPGTVDSGYRGEIGVILHNTTAWAYWVSPGDRIAQAIFVPYETPNVEFVDDVGDSERGQSGFGSTGV